MNNEKITETYDVLKTFIPKEDIYLNEPMSKHTTFKIQSFGRRGNEPTYNI